MSKRKITTEEFIEKSKQIHGDKYDYSLTNYINSYTKVKIICKKHGIFEQKPNNHLNAHVCFKCRITKKVKITENFIKESKQVHNNKYDYSLVNYIGTYNKVKIICKKHGVFEQRPNDHLNGHGCPKCKYEKISNQLKDDLQIFIKKAKKYHGDAYDYSLVEYKGSKVPVKIICKEHGIFKKTPSDHLSNRGCPRCKIVSKGELFIEHYLKEHQINYKTQKRFNDCRGVKNTLPFDFYLPDYNTCIEFDGKQHYDPKSKWYSQDLIKNDKIKNKYCINNNIKLIRISYREYKNINIIIESNLTLNKRGL